VICSNIDSDLRAFAHTKIFILFGVLNYASKRNTGHYLITTFSLAASF